MSVFQRNSLLTRKPVGCLPVPSGGLEVSQKFVSLLDVDCVDLSVDRW